MGIGLDLLSREASPRAVQEVTVEIGERGRFEHVGHSSEEANAKLVGLNKRVHQAMSDFREPRRETSSGCGLSDSQFPTYPVNLSGRESAAQVHNGLQRASTQPPSQRRVSFSQRPA